MASQLKSILDRIHCVNLEIKTVESGFDLHPTRYWPRGNKLNIADLPLITPAKRGGAFNNEQYGSDQRLDTWTIENILFVDNWMAGSGPEDAQANAEKCVDHIVDQYWNRPRLELINANAEFTQSSGAYDDIMEDVRLTQSSGFEVESNANLLVVRFTLVCEVLDDIERL